MPKRVKTNYPGVYFREAARIGGKGSEKVYYIVFKKDGKTIEEKVGRQYADDMTPARASGIRNERIEGKRKSRRKIRQEAEAHKQAELGRWTLSRLWEEYKGQRVANKGLAVDECRFRNHLAPAFGDKEPCDIITLDVDRLRIRMLKARSPQTVKHVLALLKRIIAFGVRKGLCDSPDSRKLHIEMPSVDNIKTEDLTPEQLARLLDAIEADPNLKAASIMKLALFTGMRRGEMFKLEWDDLDFENGFINIRNPKGGVSQKVPMNAAARDLLLAQPRGEGPRVFPGRDGAQLQNIQPALQRIRKNAGLPPDFRPLHGLRHVYASMLASSGQVDMYTLQKLLTHKSAAMTQRYAHLRDEALKRASDLAGDLVNSAFDSGKSRETAAKVRPISGK